MSLNKIDFSDGIRPEEIQENFEILQEQLNRERLGVGGFGIASGFDITPIITSERFAIRLSSASIIDETGSELFIPETEVDIDAPELFTALEHHTINYNNRISLNQIPYANNRRIPSEFLANKNPNVSGIYINYPANNYNVDDYIRVSEINGTVLTITGATSKEVVVRYNYTADRIDTIYLKDDNTIGVIKGTTSTTPSKPYLPNDGKMLIAYLMIESRYMDEENTIPSAFMYVKDDMRGLRNLFTDADNNLYICGTPFDDLQIIHIKEPKNPKENTLWLNTSENTLYYWKSTDGYIYNDKIEIDTDFISNDNAYRDFATYMNFLLGENELEVFLNGVKLLKDVHYYELYNELPTYFQNIPDKTEGNSFRIIEDSTSGNDLTLKVGDVVSYTIRYKDSHFMWVPINKMTYLNSKHCKTYCTDDYMPTKRDGYFASKAAKAIGSMNPDYRYQYFFFHREEDLEMLFTPGRNELTVLINQMILHSDQFEEITVNDLKNSLNSYEQNTNGLYPTWDSYMDNLAKSNAIVPKEVAEAAVLYFGWSKKELDRLDEDYDQTGIGFKLVEPLDYGYNAETQNYEAADGLNDLFVEAIVEKRICCSPSKRKFQRSATFVSEKTVYITDEIINSKKEVEVRKEDHKKISYYTIELDENEFYRYRENQLEVFINGNKLSGPSIYKIDPGFIEEFGYYLKSDEEGYSDIKFPPINESDLDEYKEQFKEDQGYFERHRADICRKFCITKPLFIGDAITYKISTNSYSHDHINDILEDLERKIGYNVDTVVAAYNGVDQFKKEIEQQVETVEAQVSNITEKITGLENNSFDPKGVCVGIHNLQDNITNLLLRSATPIYMNITYQQGRNTYVLPDSEVKSTDYLNVIQRGGLCDRYLIHGQDYEVVDYVQNNQPGARIVLYPEKGIPWEQEDIIIITGIKLNKTLDK